MISKKFALSSSVVFMLAVGSQGVFAGAEGVVVGMPHLGAILPEEFASVNSQVVGFVPVSIFGKVLLVPDEFVVEKNANASADSGAGDLAGVDGQSVNQQSASDGQSSGTGAVDAGANAASGDYTIADAVDELSGVVEFLKSAGLDGNAEIIAKVVGKLEEIAA